MLKKIGQFFLLLLFIVFVVCAVIVGTYMFSTPNTDKESDSRLLITGAWIDEDEDTKFEFLEDGSFKISKNESGDTIADGHYKIDEDGKKIKLFMFPGHYTTEFEKAVNYKFFAKISYSDLEDPSDGDEDNTEADPPTVTFLLNGSNQIYKCEMPDKTLDLYSKGKSFEATN